MFAQEAVPPLLTSISEGTRISPQVSLHIFLRGTKTLTTFQHLHQEYIWMVFDRSVTLRGLTAWPLSDPDLCDESFFVGPERHHPLYPRRSWAITPSQHWRNHLNRTEMGERLWHSILRMTSRKPLRCFVWPFACNSMKYDALSI